MNNRERFKAVMHFEPYDRLPIVHFGYWADLIDKWEEEGHLPKGTANEYRSHAYADSTEVEKMIDKKFGWDFNIYNPIFPNKIGNYDFLDPLFEKKIVKILPDGSKLVQQHDGAIWVQKFHLDGTPVACIPAHYSHALTDRKSWEELFLPRLQWFEERINVEKLKQCEAEAPARQEVLTLFGGSLIGRLRNWAGFEGLCYIQADDEDLFAEMVDTYANLTYKILEKAVSYKIGFDYCYIWEDMAYKGGPLIKPELFNEVCSPHYKKISALLRNAGIDIQVLDCDGVPKLLAPTWINNGVNTMFPIEHGTWGGSFAPYREEFGKKALGIGGMRKIVLGDDYAAVDKEIERLKPLVELGGYLPCPDHRITPEAKFENVQYYVEKMRKTFGN